MPFLVGERFVFGSRFQQCGVVARRGSDTFLVRNGRGERAPGNTYPATASR